MISLKWLASLSGEFKCFNANNIAFKNLFCARALIEITPTNPMPLKLKVRIMKGLDAEINVNYSRKFNICTNCQYFGHSMEKCSNVSPFPPAVKVPLSGMEMKRVLKIRIPPVSDPVVSDSPLMESMMESLADSVSDDEVIIWEPEENSWVHMNTKWGMTGRCQGITCF